MENKLRKSSALAANDSPSDGDRLPVPSDADLATSPELEEIYQKLQPEMRRPKPGPAEMAAALDAVKRLAAEAGAADAATDLIQKIATQDSVAVCTVCGYQNREGNKFCGMCGQPVLQKDDPTDLESDSPADTSAQPTRSPKPFAVPRPPQDEANSAPDASAPAGTHHYHHHYHHHYFPGGVESPIARVASDPSRDAERMRPSPVLRGESMTRAEAAVRRVTQDWILALNTKHLDNLLDVYSADAVVLRSNFPAVRGAAAVREFFFNALDSGLGEVELDPIRVDVVGDFAYEAGRCKSLVPGASGKRREERGKYLWVFARQSNGEWKLAADCWSSDLTLPSPDSDVASAIGPKPVPPRKG